MVNDKDKLFVPAQVESLINQMNDIRNSDQIRINYRNTLDILRDRLSKEIETFDRNYNRITK